MARRKGPSGGGSPSIPTEAVDAIVPEAGKAVAALEELEAQLRAVDRAMAQDTLAKKLAKATDPLKQQQAQLKLSMLGVTDLAAAEQKAAKAAAVASDMQAKAAKQAAKEQKKTDLAASFARVGPLAKLSGDNFERLGGIVEDRFGKRTFKAFERMSRGWKAQGDAEHKTADSLKLAIAGAEMGAGALLAMATAALTVAGALAGIAFEGGAFALKMAMFKENTQFAMKYALGSGKAAGDAMTMATRIAATLGTGVEDIAPQLQKLMGKGLGAGESEQIVQLMEDVKAASLGKVDASGLGDAFMALKNNQSLTPEMLAPLRALGPGAKDKAYASLAKSLGIREDNSVQGQHRLEAQLGRLKGQKGADALVRASLASMGHDKAGAVAKEFADSTIDGSLTKLKKQFGNLFASIESGRAGKAIVATLNKLADAFNPMTAQGKRLLALLDRMADVAGRVFEKIDVGSAIDAFETVVIALHLLDAAMDTPEMQTLVTTLKICAVGAGILAAAVGVLVAITLAFVALPFIVIGALGLLGVALVAAAVDTATWAADMATVAVEWGSNMITGLIDGITAMGPKVLDALRGLGAGMKAVVSNVLDMHSPSRVFMKFGRFTGEGMALGIDQSAPMVQGAMSAMVAPTQTAGGTGGGSSASGRAGPTITNTFHIEVNGAGDAKAVSQEVTRQIVEIFEQMGLQFGVVGPGMA